MSDARWVGRWRRSREALLYTWILADRKRNWSGSKFGQTGNTCQRLDRSGNILSSHMFDAYGAEYDSPSGTKAGPFGFGGQWGYYTDSETGLILLTNRYYDPARGRFLTRDPAGYAGGTNLFSYVGNGPLSEIDPLGLCGDDDDNSGIPELLAGNRAFWHGVNNVGNALQAGTELAASFNPVTSAGIALNKAGQGQYGQAILYSAPLLEAAAPGVAQAFARGGRSATFERFGSGAEAAAAQEAGGLVPRPGHKIQPKWIADPGAVDPRTLGKASNYTHQMTFQTDPAAAEWVKQFETKANEPSRYEIPADRVEEFNSMVRSVTVRRR